MSFTLTRDYVKRGELARRSGCNLETIRYYEDIKLMPEPARTESGRATMRATTRTRRCPVAVAPWW